jgi:hypothetical protein
VRTSSHEAIFLPVQYEIPFKLLGFSVKMVLPNQSGAQNNENDHLGSVAILHGSWHRRSGLLHPD